VQEFIHSYFPLAGLMHIGRIKCAVRRIKKIMPAGSKNPPGLWR
jgi:hypothetical protein